MSAEPVGERIAGPAIRAYELARALAPHCRVTLAAPAPSEIPDEDIELLQAGLADYDALTAAVRSHDVVVAQLLPRACSAASGGCRPASPSTSTTPPSSR